MSCTLDTLVKRLDTIMINENPNAKGLKDYCPNGLQVQGTDEIHKVAFGVTASLEFMQAAVNVGANAIVVHHGLIWNYQDRAIKKDTVLYNRLKFAMDNELNVFGYHLPLDVHPVLGNNITLAKGLGLIPGYSFGANNGLLMCSTAQTGDYSLDLVELAARIDDVNIEMYGERVQSSRVAPMSDRFIKKIAICTGAAGMYFEDAIAAGADVFITGEISEQHWHIAKETGVGYISAGHTFTESFGVQALMDDFSSSYTDVKTEFLKVFNPI